MTILLALLYPMAVQYERGGWWRLVAPLTLLALVVDVIANYTELALLTWDFPQKEEWTFSKRIPRLLQKNDWRASLLCPVVDFLDTLAPDGRHIKR